MKINIVPIFVPFSFPSHSQCAISLHWQNLMSIIKSSFIPFLFSLYPAKCLPISLSSHLSLNCEGCWGTTDDCTISFLHFFLFSTTLWDLTNSRPVHSLMLSSHLFLCLPCLLPSFTVPCKMVLARPDERETWSYHCSLCLFTMVRRSLCGLIAYLIFAWTSSLVTWSLYEMYSILW